MKSIKLLFITLSAIFISACNQGNESSQSKEPEEEKQNTSSSYFGSYASDGYEQRNEGYDWVGVTVTEDEVENIKISVRSRADQKKPSCTLDMKAEKLSDSSYRGYVSGKPIMISFTENSVKISPESEQDSGTLYFFCSGGATVAGEYRKIEGELDSTQVDSTEFIKILNLQGVGFNVSSIKKDGKTMLTVMPFGLSEDNSEFTTEIDGKVIEAEVEDMNSDGSPEVVVYTQTDDSKQYGNVIAYSVNNQKSMSQVHFPSLKGNEELYKGYEGQDEFTLIENKLGRRFPIYEFGTTTGKMRQIIYKLEEGEAMPQFMVESSSEF